VILAIVFFCIFTGHIFIHEPLDSVESQLKPLA